MADYPVLDGEGDEIVSNEIDPAYVASPYDNSADYPVLDGNGDVVVLQAFEGVSVFHPSDVAGFEASVVASEVERLYTDIAKTTNVASDGDLVAVAVHGEGEYSQSVEAQRPTYHTDGTLHWLKTDGVSEYLEGGPVFGAEQTVVMGVKIVNANTYVYGGRSSTSNRSYYGVHTTGQFAAWIGAGTLVVGGADIRNTDAVVSFRRGVTGYSMRVNGVEVAASVTEIAVELGVPSFVGAYANTTFPSQHAEAEVFALADYSEFLSDEDVARVEAFCASEVGITL